MSLRCRSSTAATAGKAFFSRAFAQASRPPPYTPASLRPFLDRQGTVILDGGLGTALGAESEQDALWGAQHLFRLEGHNKLLDLHRAFLEAGSDVISSSSYQVSFETLTLTLALAPTLTLTLTLTLALTRRPSSWRAAAARAPRSSASRTTG